MSGLFGATVIPGNRLTDIAAQTSTVGIPIPFGYGKFEADGNIIWAAEVKEQVTKKRQGKGGVKTIEYTYTRSYAIGFTAGPIYAYLTITRAGKIVFTTDPNATVEDLAYAAKWLEKATLYYGTEEQLPDSTIEAVEGAGQISAFKGLAYIVLENDDVTANGGGVPVYKAIVVASPPEVYITSKPYPYYFLDDIYSDATLRSIATMKSPVEHVSAQVDLVDGVIKSIIVNYNHDVPDLLQFNSPNLVSGELKSIVRSYDGDLPEKLAFTAPTVQSGTIKTVVVYYTNGLPELLSFAAPTIRAGTLT